MQLAQVTLDDKYKLETGRVYVTGIQALVRLPMLQRQRETVLPTRSNTEMQRGRPGMAVCCCSPVTTMVVSLPPCRTRASKF
jgi:hypothetical protein